MSQVSDGRSLSTKVRKSVNSGKQIRATVIETYFDKVTVQLVGNGQLMRNLTIIGGPVDVGATVNVDFSTVPPQVVAKGNAYLTSSDLESAIKRIGDSATKQQVALSVSLFSGGSLLSSFSASTDGLSSAMIAANDGDVIWLPDTEIEIDLTVKDGVTVAGISSRQSLIKGSVALGNNSSLENLKVVKIDRSNDGIQAVVATGTTAYAYVRNCEVHSYQCSIGRSDAIELASNALLRVENSLVVGYTGGATAYAFKVGAGATLNVTGSRIFGTSDYYDGTGAVNEYSNVDGWQEAEVWCAVPSDSNFPYSNAYGSNALPVSNYYSAKTVTIPVSPTTVRMLEQQDGIPGSFARDGDYIYFQKYVSINEMWIREYKISDGTFVDVKAFNTGSVHTRCGLTWIEDRKVMLQRPSGLAGNEFYIVDFELATSSLYYSFNDTEPSDIGNEESYKWYDQANQICAIRRGDGDLIIVAFGPFIDARWNAGLGDYSELTGTWFQVKNWTQDGPWTLVEQPAIPESEDAWGASLSYPTSIIQVQNKYLVIVPDVFVAGGTTRWNGDDVGNVNYSVATQLNLDTFESSTHFKKRTWVGYIAFPDPNFSYIGCDHASGFVYFATSTAYNVLEGGTYYAIMKYDVATGDVTVDKTGITLFQNFIYGKTGCFYYANGLSGHDVYSCADHDTPIIDETTFFSGSWIGTDNVLDDSGKVWRYKASDAKIHWLKLSDNTTGNFDPGLAAAAYSPNYNYLFALNDVFVVYRYKQTSTTAEWWLVKE